MVDEAMVKQPGKPSGDAGLVWERADPVPRPAPAQLSRAAIVGAAVAIADAEGLAAVSLRKVGGVLAAGAMRLYAYIATKDDLLDLMVDAVYGEMTPGDAAAPGWRDALRSMARTTRRAAKVHPWFADLLGARPHQGPNALAYLEHVLGALHADPDFKDIDAVMLAAKTVNAYVMGAIRSEAAERQAERETGQDKAEWQDAMAPYLSRMIATGRFPTLAKVMEGAAHPAFDVVFDAGLECVLDGVAARLAR
jgi:AcrR family transcriptional regulator